MMTVNHVQFLRLIGSNDVIELIECASGFYCNLDVHKHVPYSLPAAIYVILKAEGSANIRQIESDESA